MEKRHHQGKYSESKQIKPLVAVKVCHPKGGIVRYQLQLAWAYSNNNVYDKGHRKENKNTTQYRQVSVSDKFFKGCCNGVLHKKYGAVIRA